jgi:hypothetical protein
MGSLLLAALSISTPLTDPAKRVPVFLPPPLYITTYSGPHIFVLLAAVGSGGVW